MECIGEGTSRCGASARNASIATMAHGFDPCGHSAMKRASSAGVVDVCLSGEPEPVPVLEPGQAYVLGWPRSYNDPRTSIVLPENIAVSCPH
jgi:hypothetical protein